MFRPETMEELGKLPPEQLEAQFKIVKRKVVGAFEIIAAFIAANALADAKDDPDMALYNVHEQASGVRDTLVKAAQIMIEESRGNIASIASILNKQPNS